MIDVTKFYESDPEKDLYYEYFFDDVAPKLYKRFFQIAYGLAVEQYKKQLRERPNSDWGSFEMTVAGELQDLLNQVKFVMLKMADEKLNPPKKKFFQIILEKLK